MRVRRWLCYALAASIPRNTRYAGPQMALRRTAIIPSGHTVEAAGLVQCYAWLPGEGDKSGATEGRV